MLPVIQRSGGRDKVMPFASGIFWTCDVGVVDCMDPQSCANFRTGNASVYTQCYYMARPIWTKDGTKRVILCKDCLLGL